MLALAMGSSTVDKQMFRFNFGAQIKADTYWNNLTNNTNWFVASVAQEVAINWDSLAVNFICPSRIVSIKNRKIN